MNGYGKKLVQALLLFPVGLCSAKKALITGITGQDGSYLAELLITKGYEVHGLKRRASLQNGTERVNYLFDLVKKTNKGSLALHYGDLSDSSNLAQLLQKIQPDEIYNLGAQSHVQVSFEAGEYTADVTGTGVFRMLEAIRIAGLEKKVRFYQASSSEMFGKVQAIPQTETTSFYPRSPYAAAKLYGHWITVNYRESYGMFACSGILFNHESPRRGETFVTRKITKAVAAIAKGKQEVLELGNLDSLRDWGYAKEYVEAMWLMLQQDKPEDYVIATGQTHTVREFVERAFAVTGVTIIWQGTGEQEVGKDSLTGVVRVRVNPAYYRPAEVDLLIGDASKAHQQLGWQPTTPFVELVTLMVKADLATA